MVKNNILTQRKRDKENMRGKEIVSRNLCDVWCFNELLWLLKVNLGNI